MLEIDLRSIRALHAPNLRASFPVLEAELHCRAVEAAGELEARLGPVLAAAGLMVEAGLYAEPAALLARLVLLLQRRVGLKLEHSGAKALEGGGALILVQYEDEGLVRPALEVAAGWLNGVAGDVATDVMRLQDIADRICLGPSTRAIVNAAVRRGIPYRRLNTGSMVQFGQGVKQRRIWAAETDRTGAIGESIAGNKDLTKRLLSAVGLPVPEGQSVRSAEEAWQAATRVGVPVVVKPLDGNHGRSVFIGLTSKEEIEKAYEAAHAEEGGAVLVERCVSGCEHRLLVINGELAGAARGDALFMTGDGVSTVAELLDEMNRDPRRGESDDCPLSVLEFDPPTLAVLAHQGYTPASVPAAGTQLLLQRNGNLSTDVTDIVHPDNARLAVLAARTIGLDIAGVDLVVDDVSKPVIPQRGAIVEVNAGPGLQMHLQPAIGTPRPVGEKIMSMLFEEGEEGRIPVVAVVGGAGLTRAIGQALEEAGLATGVACAEGLFVHKETLLTVDCTSWERVSGLLMHPGIEAAVLQVDPQVVEEEGMPFDLCRLAVIDESFAVTAELRQAVLAAMEPAGAVLAGSAETLPEEVAGILVAPLVG